MHRITAPDVARRDVQMPCFSIRGWIDRTPLIAEMSDMFNGVDENKVKWLLNPRIRVRSSCLNPFITDMTMINVATPSIMPKKENVDTTATKPSF